MISVKEEIYKQLENLKNEGESFSDLFERLIQNHKKDPLRHYGIGKELPDEILDGFEKAILDSKKESAKNSMKKFKELWGE
jgi:predicted CopG family antitoxin